MAEASGERSAQLLLRHAVGRLRFCRDYVGHRLSLGKVYAPVGKRPTCEFAGIGQPTAVANQKINKFRLNPSRSMN